jgi:hypothetical protein
MTVLGVDIGVSGALAIPEDGELVEVHDMPCLDDGPVKRRSVNAPLLAELIAKAHATKADVEFVGPRPQEGAVGAFAFDRSRGTVEGTLAAYGLPNAFLTAPEWKRLIGVAAAAGAKDAARSEATRRWPDKAALFARRKDDGWAEAELIGLAGIKRKPGNREASL